jgi:glutamate-1-semialdehyde 2,1-aminomutase
MFVAATYWAQAVPMAAALATLEVIRETNYLEHTIALGQLLRDGLHERAAAHGFELSQTGPVQMPTILFKDDPDLRLDMAFTAAMMQRGIYFHAFQNVFICAAMTKEDIAQTIGVADDAFRDLAGRRFKILPHPLVAYRSARTLQPTT